MQFLPTTKGVENTTKLVRREPVYDYGMSLCYVYSF